METKFKDLSVPLKILVIFGWAMFSLVSMGFLIGIIQELVYLA